MSAPKILVIDDEYDFAAFAKMLLEVSGYAAVVSMDGKKAVESATSEKPALILMDLHLRDIDGIEAVKMLKSNPETMSIPVIICSISHERSEIQEALRCGAADFLPKPLKPPELERRIHRALGTRSA